MKPDYDVVIVGGGPAGLSAALLLARCLRRVLICDSGKPRNAPSKAMHAYLGHDGISPADFLTQCRTQLALYETVETTSGNVQRVERQENRYLAYLEDGRVFSSRALLLATGVRDTLPDIPSAAQFYGTSLHHCPYCDGWEHRGQNIGVIGNDQQAVDLALELLSWSRLVSLYTNSEDKLPEDLESSLTGNHISIVGGRVTGLHGREGAISQLEINGRRYPCEALFFSPRQNHESALAESLGCIVDEQTGAITCGLEGETRIEGLFAAGNVSKGIQMALVAAAEGLNAAAAINDWFVCCDTRTSR